MIPAHKIQLGDKSLYIVADKRKEALPSQLKNFRRRTTEEEALKGVELLHALDLLFTEKNITWSLMFGTLAGQHYFHNIIPWDDDWDVAVYSKKEVILETVKDFVEANPQFRYNEASPYFFKLYHSHSNRAGRQPWGWPFVDVFYAKENGDTIRFRPSDAIKKYDVFPLKKGLFGGLVLPIPAKVENILVSLYNGQFGVICKTAFDHKHDLDLKYMYDSVPCDRLKRHFAMVVREKVDLGDSVNVYETLQCENKFHHSLLIIEGQKGEIHKFKFFRVDRK
jgi:hypothetical protein